MTGKEPKSRRRSGSALTMRDVARHAGVSQMTVSLVVNGNGKRRISESTQQAVRDSIAALGYVPNQAAMRLASVQQLRIGLLYSSKPNAFLSSLLIGAVNATSRLGAQLHLEKFDLTRPQSLQIALDRLTAGGVSGILLPAPIAELAARQVQWAKLGIAAVAVAPGISLPQLPSVRIDERQAAFDMTCLLFERGHRRIGFITGPDTHSSSAARLDGFSAAHRDRGRQLDATLIERGDFEFESGMGAAQSLLLRRPRPTAIFASNDAMASGVIACAHRHGLHLPRDLSIAGFDDTPIATQVWPTLTTVGRDVTAMADAAVEMLAATQRARQLGKLLLLEDQLAGYRIVERDSLARPRRG